MLSIRIKRLPLTAGSETRCAADDVSYDATSNLFSWYRNNEGGLWLAEGLEDDDAIRRKNSHPWIKCGSDEDEVVESKSSVHSVNREDIIRWRNSIGP